MSPRAHAPSRAAKWIWLAAAVVAIGALAGLALLLPITWRRADLLWLLALPGLAALLLALDWHRKERATRRFGDATTLAGLTLGRPNAWRMLRGSAMVLGLCFVVFGLAGPQYGSRTRVLHKRGVDIVIALDFSKSMLARDVRPSRIERAKAELMRLMDDLDGDRVGVVAFAGETMEFPMTVDYSAVGLFLRDMGPYDMPVGGTAIGRALVASRRLLERSRPTMEGVDPSDRAQASQVVLLLTDGEDHEGDPLAAADELSRAGVKVFVVGIGSRTGEPIPTYTADGTWTGYLRDENNDVVMTALTPENETQLRQIAERTGGSYFRAREGTVGVDQIRQRLRELQQEERESRRVTVHEDRFAIALLPGFLLLVLERLLPEAWIGLRRRRRSRQPPRATRGALSAEVKR
ncbi:MAG: VWA domain-containing protein [Myxococcales bacterium]|nr:VWA domain-containing protein [Myxococcales bacterium]